MARAFDARMTAVIGERAESANAERMLKMILGGGITQIVHAVARFSIADELMSGPATASELAARCGIKADSAFRLLRACASLGLVTADEQLRFTRTPLLDTLRKDTRGSLRGMAIALASPGFWLPWGNFIRAMKTGSRQTLTVLGQEIWEYYAVNPEESAAFVAAMAGMTSNVAREVAAIVDARSVAVAADIGGAGGTLLHALMEANPHLQGILFDLPEVVASAHTAHMWHGIRDRLCIMGGDFMSAVPAADLYLLKCVLHGWDHARCVRILKNCRRALCREGRIVVIEQRLGDVNQQGIAPLLDLTMLALTSGRERTLPEYEELYAEAGLRLVAVTVTRCGIAVMETVAR